MNLNSESIKKIIIVMLGGIGNMVLLIPALRALRTQCPDKEITLMTGEPGVEEILGGSDLFNDVLFYDRTKKMNFLKMIPFLKEARKRKFDLAIASSGTNAFKGSFLTRLMGISVRVGENIKGFGYWYTHKLNYDENENEADGTLRLIESLGVNVRDRKPFLSVPEEEQAFADRFLSEDRVCETDLLVGMHSGSGLKFKEAKRWPKEKFIALGNELIRRYGARILLTGGAQEVALTKEIGQSLSAPPVTAAGRMTIRQTAAVIKRCRLFISNDSGIAHVAAAVRTPLVVIFGPADVERIAPRGEDVRIVRKNLPDKLGARQNSKILNSIKKITLEEVLAEVDDLFLRRNKI